jgi:hypothetical protein
MLDKRLDASCRHRHKVTIGEGYYCSRDNEGSGARRGELRQGQLLSEQPMRVAIRGRPAVDQSFLRDIQIGQSFLTGRELTTNGRSATSRVGASQIR